MKLLALRLCEHDSSFCFFDGKELKYLKTERIKGVKHHAFNNLLNWKVDFQNLFNQDVDDLDEVAIIVDPWIYNLPADDESFSNAVAFDHLELNCKTWRINHHYAHSLSTWAISRKEPEVSIVMDGFGDFDQSWTVFHKDEIIAKGSLKNNGSLGIEMAEAGDFLGIRASHRIDIAGKLMGLQSYGNISENFIKYLDKYSIENVKELFSFDNWIEFINDESIARLSTLDWIRNLHKKTGYLLVEFFRKFAKEDQLISFTGGIAQNVLWNTELRKHFKNIIIPPHCTDDGLTLGGIEFLRRKNNLNPFELNNFPYIQNDEAPLTIPDMDTIKKSALLLSQGHAIGWYQGNGEVGPRSLGNRSILLDPRIKNGKYLINKIKNRENYRPFGATILYEYKDDFFEIDSDPYMLFSSNVKNNSVESITHIDNTCRVQTLKNENPVFRILLEEFHRLTGCPLLLNTSMNSAGKPLVGTIKDAKIFFETTKLNYLVIGNEIFEKH